MVLEKEESGSGMLCCARSSQLKARFAPWRLSQLNFPHKGQLDNFTLNKEMTATDIFSRAKLYTTKPALRLILKLHTHSWDPVLRG